MNEDKKIEEGFTSSSIVNLLNKLEGVEFKGNYVLKEEKGYYGYDVSILFPVGKLRFNQKFDDIYLRCIIGIIDNMTPFHYIVGGFRESLFYTQFDVSFTDLQSMNYYLGSLYNLLAKLEVDKLVDAKANAPMLNRFLESNPKEEEKEYDPLHLVYMGERFIKESIPELEVFRELVNNKDYDTIEKEFNNCKKNIKEDNLVVFIKGDGLHNITFDLFDLKDDVFTNLYTNISDDSNNLITLKFNDNNYILKDYYVVLLRLLFNNNIKVLLSEEATTNDRYIYFRDKLDMITIPRLDDKESEEYKTFINTLRFRYWHIIGEAIGHLKTFANDTFKLPFIIQGMKPITKEDAVNLSSHLYERFGEDKFLDDILKVKEFIDKGINHIEINDELARINYKGKEGYNDERKGE